jgi:salicylate hydroxylase
MSCDFAEGGVDDDSAECGEDQMTTAHDRTAIVVGGGIGGLTAARALAQRGWSVTVLERARSIAEVGAGIQISPNSSRVLRALGVYGELERSVFRPEALEMRVGSTGERIFRIDLAEDGEKRWGAPYLHIARYDLIRALSQTCAGVTVRTGAEVLHYLQDAESVTVTLLGGEQVTAAVLVGADGIHSLVRDQMLGPDRPRFTGNVAWRVLVPMDRLGRHRPPPTTCVWVGHRRHAVTYRVGGGAYANLVAVVEHAQWRGESWTEQGTRDEAARDFHGWHPTITDIIESAEQHHRWALFDRDTLPWWTDGRVALLGDACHPMLPFQAQGAAMAIEDAWVLADQLARGREPRDALARYAQMRLPRTSKVQAESRNNAARFHHGDVAQYQSLHAAAREDPDQLIGQFDWLYGHDVTL